MKNKIASIVVTYNRKKLLEECINRLLDCKTKELTIYIIDNASTDGTKEMINKKFKDKVRYVNTGENLGGAGGFNYGMKHALNDSKYDYLWIMDDDTIVHKDSLEKLLEKAKILNNDFSYLSSIALWTDNNLCDMNVQSVGRNTIEEYKKIKDGIICINSASFVSCLINVETIKEVGLPIKEFFIYGDDFEYTKRLGTIKKGFLVPESIVTHKMNSNTGINLIDAEKTRIDRYYYNFRNLLYTYKKYDKKQYRIYKLKCYYMIMKCLIKSKNSRIKRAKVVIKALKESKKFNPKIEFIGEEK